MLSWREGDRGRRSCGFRGAWSVACLCLTVAACGGGPQPVDDEFMAREEARLVEPFAVDRSLVADDLEITMTANFYSRLALPSILPGVQEEETNKRPDGTTEYVMRTRPDSPLRFELDATKFYVMKTARVTVLGGRSDLTLRAEVDGNVSIVENGVRRDTGSVRIENGSFRMSEVTPR